MALPDNLAAWLQWLETRNQAAPIVLGLERVQTVWARLKQPLSIPVITVAGTNGKGSTCAFLDAILRAGGYRVGLYTSPHLLRYNERVRLEGVEASDAELVAAFAAVETARGEIALTYFEHGTLAALWLFVQQAALGRLDALVLEVGLGGRLDAVNIIDPDCAVITPIDLDHQAYLGADRASIGREKAGITRPDRQLVCSDRNPPDSVRQAAVSAGFFLGRDFELSLDPEGRWALRLQAGDETVHFVGLPRPNLLGVHQYANAAAACVALWALRARLPLPVAAVRGGLVSAQIAGRFQVIGQAPLRVVDVAHNPHAARTLAAQLADLPPTGQRFAVYAALADKDIAGVIAALQGQIQHWHIAPVHGWRGSSVECLGAALTAADCAYTAHVSVAAAWHAACRAAGPADTIAAFGSFHSVAAVLAETPEPPQTPALP